MGGEIGYTTKKMHLSFLYSYSKFESANEFLFWRTPSVQTGPNMDMSTIAPDNKMQRYVLNGVFRQMPFDSTLALRATYAKYENDFQVPTTFLSVTGSQPAGIGNTRLANPRSPNFSGDVQNEYFSAAYNSNWSREWSSKLYYNYYKRDNKSTDVVFTPSGPGSGGTCDANLITGVSASTCSTDPLHFTKNKAGAEAYWRINSGNKLTLGLDYQNVERERVDFDRTKDLKVFGEWKSGNWEVADIRVKYTHLDRDADFQLGNAASPFDRDLLRFDVAPLQRDILKIVFDAYPAPMLDVGVEFSFKRNRYKDTTLGRTDDRREEVAFSVGYGDAKTFRVSSFFDREYTYYDSNHWVGDVATYPTPNPSAGAYFWQSRVHDHNYLFGAAADWVASDTVRFYASAIWQKGDGGVDFTAPSVAQRAEHHQLRQLPEALAEPQGDRQGEQGSGRDAGLRLREVLVLRHPDERLPERHQDRLEPELLQRRLCEPGLPHEHPVRNGDLEVLGPRYQVPGITSTGTFVRAMSLLVTEPSARPARAPCPRVPVTMRSMPSVFA